jgi:hypothetical protein
VPIGCQNDLAPFDSQWFFKGIAKHQGLIAARAQSLVMKLRISPLKSSSFDAAGDRQPRLSPSGSERAPKYGKDRQDNDRQEQAPGGKIGRRGAGE